MKILITGANGQLAKALKARLSSRYDLLLLTREALDITDELAVKAVFEHEKPTMVINTAAYNLVDQAESDVDSAMWVNGRAPGILARCATDCGARLIHVSTDFVFSGQKALYSLNDQPDPISVYGQSKAQGERAVLDVSPSHLVIRTAWVYSPNPGNFVTNMLELMKTKTRLTIVDDQIGSPTATASLALAIERAIECPEVCGLQHITDAGVASRYDFAVMIHEYALSMGLLSQPIELLPVSSQAFTMPAKRPHSVVLDKQATWQALGIEPKAWQLSLKEIMTELKKAHAV
ncbi:MAG: dTDP-4-dehydrorhamnose reductase [Gammaproteobacteria bacterium CG11_big_fil_rev_8_21_14_0_20_46_22]|nr:MAG: dTDP-4-dehydrorhamnose reductase [Gammaproteobacteria bacterium CG12_big_fil_rev_8_21_14_0_65_46_12]PIR11285.1 MAG: dTDP-4-dehydrorhamnose reductase [Gammaproteobacteria bacterium CG11_big_fil_rev_8_21_14_0_20_46_22]